MFHQLVHKPMFIQHLLCVYHVEAMILRKTWILSFVKGVYLFKFYGWVRKYSFLETLKNTIHISMIPSPS